jgi:glycerol-3-phosphate acyltransferase PlsY
MITVIVISIGLFLGAFLVGSIPFGYIVGRLFFHTDIRRQGSGNIGAMNALRALGKGGALAVLLLDALKGFLPVLWAMYLFGRDLDPDFVRVAVALVAAGAVAGHCFSPWLRFRGGKGVATFIGALFGFCWPAGLVAVLGWAAGAAVTRYSSVGSMVGCVAAAVTVWSVTQSLPETAFAIFAAILIVFKHRDNIARLRAGTEGPIRLAK